MKTLKVAAFVAASMVTPAAADTITVRISEHFPITHIGSQSGAQAFIQRVEELVPGRVDFQHYPGEQLARAAGQLDAVRTGVADMAVVGLVYVTGQMPLSTAVEIPGLYTDAMQGARAFTHLARNDLLEIEYLSQGVRPLFNFVVTPFQLLRTEKEPLTDLSQLQGEPLRVAGATGELIANSLGAVGVAISPTDLYLSLERGVVEGAVANPASQFVYSTERILESFTTNASLGNVAFALLVNERTWQQWPEDVREAMLEAGAEAGEGVAQAYYDADQIAYDKLREMGKTVYELSPEVQAQMTEALQAVEQTWLSQMAERNLPGEEILAKFKEYLDAEAQ
jgi:TRAP-type C4-dicarboxylate transport system substrate-binding protein